MGLTDARAAVPGHRVPAGRTDHKGAAMAVELHVDMTTLAAIVARSAQVRMHSLYMPASQGLYLDHADVVEGEVRWSFPARGPQLALPIDVFVVRRDELVAAPNTTPAGATRAAGGGAGPAWALCRGLVRRCPR